MSDEATPEATELVYAPEPSWVPILVAAGIAVALAGIFTMSILIVFGLLLVLPALRAWAKGSSRDTARLPRRQRVTTAVLPAVPPRKPS